jgi:hypothetical protein
VNPPSRIAALTIALVLVGVPLGVLLAARATTPHTHESRLAIEVRRLTAQLRRNGATDIRCAWTGYADGSTYTVTCNGRLDGGSSLDSLEESRVATVTSGG